MKNAFILMVLTIGPLLFYGCSTAPPGINTTKNAENDGIGRYQGMEKGFILDTKTGIAIKPGIDGSYYEINYNTKGFHIR